MSAMHENKSLNKNLPFIVFTNDGSDLLEHHWHKEVEIIYVQRGILKLGVNNEIIQLKEGEFFLINSGDIHFFLSSPDSIRMVIQFDLSIFGELKFMNSSSIKLVDIFNNIHQSSMYWENELKEEMISIFKELEHEFNNKEYGFELAIKSKLFDIALLAYRKSPRANKNSAIFIKKDSSILKMGKILEYIEKNFMNAITLQDAASYIGFTTTYFARFFKKNTGFTFNNYLNKYRINKAKWHLFNEDKSIINISSNVGFFSVKTFNRVFKNELGVSPTQYKKQYLSSSSQL